MYQTDIRFVYLLQSCLHARDLIIRSEISHGASPVCSRKQRRNREPQTAAHRQFSDKAHHKSAIILGQARNRTAAASLFRAGLARLSERQISDLIPPLFRLRCHPHQKERLDDLVERGMLRNNEDARARLARVQAVREAAQHRSAVVRDQIPPS